ncbi:uncharacterized protein LOC134901984 [Pseudophryne corroboree]|uniref:uncharacterized protein LOC134901984 n=1 Tax=Pseudophryne corroboree TaxID=495146 RepID=UPI003081F765
MTLGLHWRSRGQWGASSEFQPHVGSLPGGSLGNRNCVSGLQAGIRRGASSPFFQIGPTAFPPREGDSVKCNTKIVSSAGGGRGSPPSTGKELLFNHVCGSETGRFGQTHIEFKISEPILEEVQVQDGIAKSGHRQPGRGDFMVSLDIKDAYLHVPIYPPHQAYLRFAVQDCHYQFQTLPFGLSTAPRIFTKVMAEMMVLLRKQGVTIIPYLDDLLIKARSREQLLNSVSLSLKVLQQHGWILNIPKSQLVPTTRLPFLGMILDTTKKRVYLPIEKAQELMTLVRNLLKSRQVSVHHCTRVLGKMVASFEDIPFGRFHARTFQWDLLDKWSGSHLQMHRLITLSPRARVSLLWWLQSAHLLEGRRFGIQDWILVTTDASLRGWGAVTQGRNFQGLWSSQETCLHINILELRAIYNALRQAEALLRDQPVLIQSNNITAVAHVNCQGGTRSRAAMAEATRILRWAENHVSALSAVFIPGVDNLEADFLSRHDLHPGEWGLHPEVFTQIVSRWELPQIDMMASRLNKKLQRYCARSRDSQAVAVDALVTPWVFRSVYVFPPLPLIPKVLRIVRRKGVRTILVVPDWPRRTWYPDLQEMLTEDPWPLPLRQDLLQQGPCLFQDLPRLRLTAWRLNTGS